MLTRNYGANVSDFVRMLVNWTYVETLGKMITQWSYTSWNEWESISMLYFFMIMWLDVSESKYHEIQEEKGLSKSPKAKNAEIIICWTILGALIVQRQKYFDSQPVVEGSTVAIKVVCVFFGGFVMHSLMIQPSFLH